MEMITCQLCGKTVPYDRYRTKFCGRDCYNKFRVMLVENGVNAWQQTVCKHNEGVACNESKCDTCGWNPAVAKKRSECMV